jgi:hypothetical protein
MGDIKVYNDASVSDNPDNVTSYNGEVMRVSTFIDSLQVLTDTVAQNTSVVQSITQDASEDFDSFKEVQENMSIDDFIEALNS